MLQPTYDDLAALVVAQAAEIARLKVRVLELEAQLKTNSRNSSKPPSSDGLAKPAPKSLRRKSGRKPGGQAGHPGSTLAQVADPDEVVRHEPGACGGCGAGLADAVQVGVERRQVFDLPPISVRVTEHQVVTRRCRCGQVSCGAAPDGVIAPVQYGSQITAIILYLYMGQFLSKKRTAQALAELFGTPVSEGTVAAVTRRASGGLTGFLELVRGRIAEAPVAHFDETGFRVAGKLHWVHSASTGKYSLITVHRRRGVKGMDHAGVLSGFAGVAVHDAWAPYDTYTQVTHALCNSHLLRELQAVADLAPTGQPWCWATQAADALLELKELVEAAIQAGRPAIDAALAAEQTQLLRSAVRLGVRQNQARSSKTMARHHALARRILDRYDDYLRFTTDFRIPFDNNAAEREIRMVKLRQKVSGCARTLTGARQFTAIRSYLATAAKHGTTFFHALVQLAEGRPWLPATQ
ncbi:MAG TPA: IS66 family transposase [Actinophytocola sp.]|uniref:IS66 family transposase n=1 Tax=Actinophytocola sp. TaxID=1872138 RepID=UPI002DFE41F3|nr:IS66 family transposase [Actinophytocola sp.]